MQRGITLVETLVAVTVLTFALGGPFTLAAQSLRAAGYAREEVIASRLAEESLEMVHSIRDNNSIDGNTWTAPPAGAWQTLTTQSAAGCAAGSACVLGITQQSLNPAGNNSIWLGASVIPCGVATCASPAADVYLNPNTGVYAQFSSAPGAPWVKQPITRQVILAPLTLHAGATGVAEYTVTVTVTYTAGPQKRTLKVSDTVRDWFPQLTGGTIQ